MLLETELEVLEQGASMSQRLGTMYHSSGVRDNGFELWRYERTRRQHNEKVRGRMLGSDNESCRG